MVLLHVCEVNTLIVGPEDTANRKQNGIVKGRTAIFIAPVCGPAFPFLYRFIYKIFVGHAIIPNSRHTVLGQPCYYLKTLGKEKKRNRKMH